MNAVIIFDVSHGATAVVRENLQRNGYFNYWTIPNPQQPNAVVVYNLPHNMVWKKDVEANQAMADIQAVIVNVNAFRAASTQPLLTLERCIVLNSTPWSGIPGVRVT